MYRNGKAYDVFRNVLVRNCVIWNDWGKCLEIGAETRAEEICDVVFENCDIIHLTGPALDCMNVDYADAHDITWRDIRIELDDVIPQPMLQNTDKDTFRQQDPDFVPPIPPIWEIPQSGIFSAPKWKHSSNHPASAAILG